MPVQCRLKATMLTKFEDGEGGGFTWELITIDNPITK